MAKRARKSKRPAKPHKPKAAKRPKPAKQSRAAKSPIPVRVFELGVPVRLVYRKGGVTYRHECDASSRVCVPADGGDFVILRGVRVGAFLEG